MLKSIKHRKKIIFIFFSILISLFAHFFITNVFLDLCLDCRELSDQNKYWKLSNLLLEGKFFDESFGSLRMPLYPLFLFIIKLFTQKSIFVIIIQILIGFFNIFQIYLLANQFEKKNSYLVIILGFLNLNLINASNFILTESIFMTFYLFFLYFFIKIFSSKKKKVLFKYLIYSSIFLGLSTLTRPIAYYFLVVIVLIFLLKHNLRTKFISIFVFLITFFIVISPWQFRNYYYFEKYELSTSVSDNLIGYYLPYIIANDKKISLSQAKKIIYQKNNFDIINSKDENRKKQFFYQEIKKVKILSILETWTEGSIKFIFAPAVVETFFNLKIKKDSFSSLDEPSFIKKSYNYIFNNSNKIYGYTLIISIIIGLIIRLLTIWYFFIFFKKNIPFNLFFLLIFFLNLALVGPLGSARYRLIIEPFLIIYFYLSINIILKKFFTVKKIEN